ncbi:SCO family protein [Anaeromyxobacter paludicola]|uniref:Electron transporter SenC n=1 Tax=Anaeromyxobacter paludicola TaxID=2918171 RepID=A0ABM7XF99_9BACT|nr:SCO family protein [Anaeromyxobacter paludicola]BDG10523.1 electron transporter SenC [Anaeromyxobacter paludicola]
MTARLPPGLAGRLAAAALVAALALPARASAAKDPTEADDAADAATPDILRGVEVEERLGASVPLDARFVAADGRPLRLGDLLGRGRPVILTLVYYNCPMLCGLVLGGQARAMRQTGLELGKDFDAVTVSFDPREGPALAAERQSGYLQATGKPDARASWAFLTGQEPDIRVLADAVGFHYKYDAATKQFAHAAAIFVLTPEGKVSRYLYGIDFPPRDLRLALVEAGGGRVGTSFDKVLLTCYRYDATGRRYTPYVFGFIRAGGLLVFAALATTLAVFWRREARKLHGRHA